MSGESPHSWTNYKNLPGTIVVLKLKGHHLRNVLGLRESGMIGQPSTNEGPYPYLQILKKYESG